MTVSMSLIVSGSAGITATNATDADYRLPEGGLAWPDFAMRQNFSPDSADLPGTQLLSSVLGTGTLALRIAVQGSTMADLQTKRRALEAAFSQSGQTLTVRVQGEDEVYPFVPTWPTWGPVDSGAVAAGITYATLSVTVNPPS